MKRINISEIEDDMVLARPVLGPDGNILLNQGVVLKANISTRLKSWGVSVIYVEGGNEEQVEDSKSEMFEKQKERLNKTFEFVKDNPRMAFLYQTAIKYYSKK